MKQMKPVQQSKMEILLGTLLLIILFVRFGPLAHSMFSMSLSVVLSVIFALYTLFIWKEKPRDEREVLHNRVSDKYGFLLCALVLIGAVVYQSITNMPDPLILLALFALVVGKMIGSIVARKKY